MSVTMTRREKTHQQLQQLPKIKTKQNQIQTKDVENRMYIHYYILFQQINQYICF